MTFGDWNSLFLGLDKLHNLTTGTPTRYEVRVDLQTANESAYAVYDFFQVASSKERYRLTVGKYRGTAGACSVPDRPRGRVPCVHALGCRVPQIRGWKFVLRRCTVLMDT